MNKFESAQYFLKERKLDGWLLYDFHRSNELAHRFLSIPSSHMVTRRFFYWIPVEGEPVKLVHAIEAQALDHCPGEKRIYASWQALEEELKCLVQGKKKIAMEYGKIPYVSKVDGGTVDLVRSMGVDVVSSGDFLLYFTSVLTKKQMESQKRAATLLNQLVQGVWHWIRKALHEKQELTEYQIQQWLLERFKEHKLITDAPPIVALNAHSADPHFETPRHGASKIQNGDLLLIDLWAKEETEEAIYGDLTKVAVAAIAPTLKQQEIFHLVRSAQKASIALVRERFAKKEPLQGWEVDEAARTLIRNAGHAEHFIHRTGHNIETHLHGSGTHMDNLEMHDTRPLLPMTCFSVEPGIYLPGEFGVRLESDVLVYKDGTVEVTGGEQDRLECLLTRYANS
ncbi:MAG TPA: M24 family metallopeptidase [Chlamydiales bacterium]|jgi:Xaa-Pro aminopeptidase